MCDKQYPGDLFRWRNVDKVIRSSVSNILLDFLHFEVHCLQVKGDIIHDIGDGLTGILENIVEHYVWVGVHG